MNRRVCKACKGTGKRSAGGKCIPCSGSGKPSRPLQRQWATNRIRRIARRIQREMSFGRDTPITDRLFEQVCAEAVELGVSEQEIEEAMYDGRTK